MTVLQAGLPKSGNFWLYKILDWLLDFKGTPKRSYIQSHPIYHEAKKWRLSFPEQADIDVIDILDKGYATRIDTRFFEPILDIDSYISACRHLWTHAPIKQLSEPLFRKIDRVIYIIRDPRDAFLSFAEFQFTPFMREIAPTSYEDSFSYMDENAVSFAKQWSDHVTGYLHLSKKLPIHLIFYERMLIDPEKETRRLAEFIGIELDSIAQHTLLESVSFGALRQGREGHVNQGKQGRWIGNLSARQQKSFNDVAGQLLTRLGYPLRSDQTGVPF